MLPLGATPSAFFDGEINASLGASASLFMLFDDGAECFVGSLFGLASAVPSGEFVGISEFHLEVTGTSTLCAFLRGLFLGTLFGLLFLALRLFLALGLLLFGAFLLAALLLTGLLFGALLLSLLGLRLLLARLFLARLFGTGLL